MIRKQNPWRDRKKGECGIQYVYRPYHGWRHGYRREKVCRWIVRIAKLLLVVEGVILTVRYLKQNTYEKVYEREAFWMEEVTDEIEDGAQIHPDNQDNVGEYYGIGVGAEDGSLFWFHKKTEEIENIP